MALLFGKLAVSSHLRRINFSFYTRRIRRILICMIRHETIEAAATLFGGAAFSFVIGWLSLTWDEYLGALAAWLRRNLAEELGDASDW